MDIREKMIQTLISAKIPSPRLEADRILKSAAPQYPNLTEKEYQQIKDMLNRRCSHEPLDKIIGCREFYKSVFKVSTAVLSPRPDTEILVESALEILPTERPQQILDLGTGSGCILLSILQERPQIQCIGIDISLAALQIAQQNAQAQDLMTRVNFINSNWKDLHFKADTFDMIVSNPPYIPQEEIKTLDPEVKDYDPLIALDGGTDGLKCYHELAEIIPLWLKTGGHVLLEVGAGQAKTVTDIFRQRGLKLEAIKQDLAGIERCVIMRK